MEKTISLLNMRIKNIRSILEDIETEKSSIVKDYYELTDTLYTFLQSKDITWLDLFYKMVKSFIDMGFVFENNDDIKKTLLKSKFMNQEFLNYFFDGLKLYNIKNVKVEEDVANEEIEDEVDNVEIENNNNIKYFENFKWHDGQLEALKKIKDNEYKSGIVSMITGGGKSLIFLKSIYEHFKTQKTKPGSVYILMCPRIDILRSLFFTLNKSGEYVLNTQKVKEWKKYDIIDLDQFNLIDYINHKSKDIEYNKKKCNLLLINNDFFRSLYADKKQKKYISNNTNFMIIDECHCMSGNKIYEIVDEMKYDHKIPIIGFSATPIRPTKASEQNVKNIFSKTDDRDTEKKKINLIYSYDLLQGIKDEIVLPYRIECVKINQIKEHKIGFTNKDILHGILQKCIENKTKVLPYKKIIIWTNRKNIMRECYQYIEKTFPKLAVYCTSSFDKEFTDEGFNTNYEDFYKSDGNSVLICINKCKEGSDIPKVDCGIYFDGVKNRSILVYIQTSGRMIRPDKLNKKTHGDLIDTFVLDKNEGPHTLTAQKLLTYLTRLLNLAEGEYDDMIDVYNEMVKLANNMEYNVKEQTLKIKIDENSKHDTLIHMEKMEIHQMDWIEIKNELMKQVQKKFGVSDADVLKEEFLKTKEKIKDMKLCSEVEYIAYAKIQNLTLYPEDHFDGLWKGWYDFLNVDTRKFPNTLEMWKRKCNEYRLKNKIDYDKYYSKYNLPAHPKELYKFSDLDAVLLSAKQVARR